MLDRRAYEKKHCFVDDDCLDVQIFFRAIIDPKRIENQRMYKNKNSTNGWKISRNV
jgi:hypothetical protein